MTFSLCQEEYNIQVCFIKSIYNVQMCVMKSIIIQV